MFLWIRRTQLLSLKCQSKTALSRSAALGIQEREDWEP